MKKMMMVAVVLLAGFARADLVPDTIPISWARSDLSTLASTNTYLAGVTYRLTNCLCYNPTNPVLQSLTNLTIQVRAGDNNTNLLFSGTMSPTNGGAFTADFSFPSWTPSPAYGSTRVLGLQLTLIDPVNGISMTYNARKLFNVALPLGATVGIQANTGIAVTTSNNLVWINSLNTSCTGFVFRAGTNIIHQF